VVPSLPQLLARAGGRLLSTYRDASTESDLLSRKEHDKEFFSPLEKDERRAGLRRLDDLLLALEELNMREAGEIPTSLKEKLLREGVPIHGDSINELIDVVLRSQQQFMLQERRTGRRRRRLTYVPTEDDLISVISGRYER
jgi:hypothetical protein